MTLKEIANTLVDACRTGNEAQLLDTIYAPNAVSVKQPITAVRGARPRGWTA